MELYEKLGFVYYWYFFHIRSLAINLKLRACMYSTNHTSNQVARISLEINPILDFSQEWLGSRIRLWDAVDNEMVTSRNGWSQKNASAAGRDLVAVYLLGKEIWLDQELDWKTDLL